MQSKSFYEEVEVSVGFDDNSFGREVLEILVEYGVLKKEGYSYMPGTETPTFQTSLDQAVEDITSKAVENINADFS